MNFCVTGDVSLPWNGGINVKTNPYRNLDLTNNEYILKNCTNEIYQKYINGLLKILIDKSEKHKIFVNRIWVVLYV